LEAISRYKSRPSLEIDEVEAKPAHVPLLTPSPSIQTVTLPSSPLPPLPPRFEAPIWLPNNYTSQCLVCFSPFTVLNRRHHCRYCGTLVCNSCSLYRVMLPTPHGTTEPERICDLCIDSAKSEFQVCGDNGSLYTATSLFGKPERRSVDTRRSADTRRGSVDTRRGSVDTRYSVDTHFSQASRASTTESIITKWITGRKKTTCHCCFQSGVGMKVCTGCGYETCSMCLDVRCRDCLSVE
jgi:hypothetical protein